MRFKTFLVAVLFVFLCLPATQSRAGTFFDDFNDGNANGWVFPSTHAGTYGDWSVEGGRLVQHSSGDHYRALVDNLSIADQVVEVEVNAIGYGGVVLWSQNEERWISVVAYPAWEGIVVYEVIDGVGTMAPYQYPTNAKPWYKLRVDADSKTGQLAVYLDDSYKFTYNASTQYRSGLSGVFAGNAVGYFDNFSLTSNKIHSAPQGGPNKPNKTITAPVPQTGQKTSYYAGDDGDLEAGVPWPDPRFTDLGDGTVRDNLTGLIWLKDAGCIGQQTWVNALDTCNALASPACGLTDGSVAGDWRLPNLRELQSLIDYGRFAPALPEGHPFTIKQFYFYWSSTTSQNVSYPNNSWGVRIQDGYVRYDGPPYEFFAWCVRGNQ